MKKIVLVALPLLLVACVCGCSSGVNNITINGAVEETIEVGTEYEDSGVKIPKNYTFQTVSFLNSYSVGRYEIMYVIYSSSGEKVKELHRFVNVVDTTGPTYIATDIDKLEINHRYTISDFISSYRDNSFRNDSIIVESLSDLFFDKRGTTEVKIKLKDQFGNETIYQKTFEVDFYLEPFIARMKDKDAISFTTDSRGFKWLRIQIDNNASLAYVYNNNHLIYNRKVETNLGSYASVQMSVVNDDYKNANLDYHVSNSGVGSNYSTGFITFDAEKKYESFNFTNFSSVINNLNFNEKDMINELNGCGLDVLNEFRVYMYSDWSKVSYPNN